MNRASTRGAVEEPEAPHDRLSRSRTPTAPPAPGDDDAGARRSRLALHAALLVGALLRLLQYAVNRSIWLDEGLLAANFLPRGWAGLLQPLTRGQTAPLGFLAVEKLAATLLGPSELALRLFPLLCGLATLALLPRVASRYLSRAAVPLAVAVVALAPFLVYYSSEVKQYAVDALIALAILGCAAALAERPHDRRLHAAFALLGVAALWLSQPAVFMLGGTGIVLGLRALRARDRAALGPLAASAALWVVAFAGSYAVSRHEVMDPEYMHAFWRTGFLPVIPRTAADWAWLPRMLARVFREPLGIVGEDRSPLSLVGAVASGVAFLVGCAWMGRRRPLQLALLLAPAGLALLASAAGAFPFGGEFQSGGRVLIFLIPSVAFVLAEGAAALPRLLPGTAGRAAFAALALLVMAPSLSYAARSVPHLRNEVKPLLDYAAEQRRPGDVIYVYYNGLPSFEYYAARYGWTAESTVRGVCARSDPAGYVADLERLRGRPRVWLLFVDGTPVQGYDEKPLMMDALAHLGRRLDDRVAIGASLYLYDLSGAPDRGDPFRANVPHFRLDASQQCRGAWGPANGA